MAGGRAVAWTGAAPHKAPDANEDAVGVFPRGPQRGLLAVADGVGGHAEGAHASRTVLECLWDASLAADPEAGSLRGPLLDAIERADAELRARGSGAATTLVAAELDANTLRAVHAGDAALLVIGGRGRIKLQTRAHSPVGYAVEAGLLGEDEARHSEDRHLISNAVGLSGMHIEVGIPLRLAPRDTVLLASDGLFDNLGLEEITALACRGPLEDAVARLVERARTHMSEPSGPWPSHPDDLSVLAFRPGKG